MRRPSPKPEVPPDTARHELTCLPVPRRRPDRLRATRAAEHAGATEPFRDPSLYDWEYRRRRADVSFYRMLADERGGPILDLGCGSGRLAIPLLRDGHPVVGVDLSEAMLARARAQRQRLPGPLKQRGLFVRGDLRRLPVRGAFPFIGMAFHTIQHLIEDDELLSVLRAVRERLTPDGWFAFDVFFPSAAWLARPPGRRFDRTIFRHPGSGRRTEYSVSHRLDARRRALHMFIHYRPLSAAGVVAPRGRVIRLVHRQLPPTDVARLLRRAGLRTIARWSGFHGEPFVRPEDSEQHVYLTRRA